MTSSHHNKWSIRLIILIGVFASLVTIATSIRIPLPALVGSPFVHFGSSVFLLATLLLGFIPGALVGSIGFAIFDILNGFAAEAPYFVLESFIVAGIVTAVFKLFHPSTLNYLYATIAGALAKIAMTFMKNIVMSLLLGASFNVSVTSSIGSLYITIINALTSIIFVSIMYPILKKIIKKR
ncbi:ECF transporter S component [Vagococcus xieshaowenii]|uniref:ECF transporter S component n=1 Tax=Vagococcus xieshaowenii TaxID=2562451 RepID=A0AAJ5EFT9_9ENTE|nr:ECF transporter S component [Vagococcus xieshaowenii]QCA28324.1 hypothetical protein E4Z98_02980 [Vagococcus xieshaowenii]TFZ42288.1 hypothetical protein E4031_03670 [Vagococcus xieshaowenii]